MAQHDFDEIRRTASQDKRPDEMEAARKDQAEEIRVEDAEKTRHLAAGIDDILDLIRPEDSEKPHIQEKLRKLCAMLPSTGEGQQVPNFPTTSSKKMTDDILRQREIEERARGVDQNKQPSEKRESQHVRAIIKDEGPSRKKKRQIQDPLWTGIRPGSLYARYLAVKWNKRDVSVGSVMDKSMDDSALDENWSVTATTGRRTHKLPRPETPELRSAASRDMNVSSAETFGRAVWDGDRKQAGE
ncbi:hypothetical protein CBER1_11346 [Cercospora berteroae]|uniref:Uncharacterized protein n=1 Tax=Cercospora berteroae TaxID=357750 RepID=A0A2S6BZ34_9PEZI|nr:hypothetical protein CBER1_11346 [Cercospora berteroae]